VWERSTTVLHTVWAGEITCFDDHVQIRRCDWLKYGAVIGSNTALWLAQIRRCDWLKYGAVIGWWKSRLCMCPVWVSRLWEHLSQSQHRICPWSSYQHGISPHHSV